MTRMTQSSTSVDMLRCTTTRSTTVMTSSGGTMVSALMAIEAEADVAQRAAARRSTRPISQPKRERLVDLGLAAHAADQQDVAAPGLAQAELVDRDRMVVARGRAGRAPRRCSSPDRRAIIRPGGAVLEQQDDRRRRIAAALQLEQALPADPVRLGVQPLILRPAGKRSRRGDRLADRRPVIGRVEVHAMMARDGDHREEARVGLRGRAVALNGPDVDPRCRIRLGHAESWMRLVHRPLRFVQCRAHPRRRVTRRSRVR